MHYLLKLIEGILQAFGIIAGFIIAIVWMLHKAGGAVRYEPDDLLRPFEDYLDKVILSEQYDQINPVKGIISELKAGKLSEGVNSFQIKKDTAFHIKDDEGNTTLRVVTKYMVVKRLNELE